MQSVYPWRLWPSLIHFTILPTAESDSPTGHHKGRIDSEGWTPGQARLNGLNGTPFRARELTWNLTLQT